MRFRLILWILAFLMKRGSKKNNAFKEQLKGQNLIFQISSQDGVDRHYIIKELQISSCSGKIQNPSFEILFRTSDSGFNTLMAKNIQKVFMQGVQNKDIKVSGDFSKVMWFQQLIRSLLSKKETHDNT